jgi:hypothetical protein
MWTRPDKASALKAAPAGRVRGEEKAMITLEQVEKLKERANVSYEDAKNALENTKGDLLEAVIFLEQQGKIRGPGLGYYNTQTGGGQGAGAGFGTGGPGQNQQHQYQDQRQHQQQKRESSFKAACRSFWDGFKTIIHKANTNHFEVVRDNQCVMNMPVTILAIGILFFFWLTVPILIIALFFGYRYRFRGPDLGRESINKVMDQVADTADNIKRSAQTEETNAAGNQGSNQNNN